LRLLTVREAAELLGVSRRQIDKWTMESDLKYILVGRERRYPVWHLEEFQRSQLGIVSERTEIFLESGVPPLTRVR
jgi:excisionase family DNA binding protein